jgi:hypothetical protein
MNKSYSFAHDEEPTDELLCELMHEVSVNAKQKAEKANAKFWQDIHSMIAKSR